MHALYLNHQRPVWFQFVTSTFCHANYAHLSSNAFFLYVFAPVPWLPRSDIFLTRAAARARAAPAEEPAPERVPRRARRRSSPAASRSSSAAESESSLEKEDTLDESFGSFSSWRGIKM